MIAIEGPMHDGLWDIVLMTIEKNVDLCFSVDENGELYFRHGSGSVER